MSTPETQTTGESRPPLALIAGPTASGKSALAIALAERTDGVVINCDASQVYRDLSILSARPSNEDMARVPHRLFGHIDGAEACSAPRWANEAKAEIAAAHREGKLPILVGGTGLYIRTLLDGIAPVPDIDPEIRAAARELPVSDAHDALLREDPEAAARLAPADTTRVIRALEVVRSTGLPLRAWQAHKEGGIDSDITLRPLILLPPRDWLLRRCDARFDAMLSDGAVEEVRAIVKRKLTPELPAMRAIGVREIASWLAGDITPEIMLERGKLATRQYAKRQYTWFSNQPPIHWPKHVEIIDNNNIDRIVTLLQH